MRPERDDLDTLERNRRLLAACERFEDAWRAGSSPRIEEFLTDGPGELRATMLRDLIAVEVELRRRCGEEPTRGEYEARFPDEAGWIAGMAFPAADPTWPGVDAVEPEPPPSVGRYELREELGRGGFGVVYRGLDSKLERYVALKVMRETFDEPEGLARFRREAHLLARLDHPNIVRVFECGETAGVSWLAMELVSGPTLATRLQQAPLPPLEAAALVESVAEAVAYAHVQGVVHRDLKPSNVLLTADGTPKVTDFGLAKQAHHEQATMTGAVLGSPQYMAPEQTEGSRDVGPAADVWALGVILYQGLTGRLPFASDSRFAVLDLIRTRDPVPPRKLNPTVPRDLETVCLKCLHKEPRRRYPTAESLADDLRRFRLREPVSARRVGLVERAWRYVRRRPANAVILVLLLLVVALAGLTAAAVQRERHTALVSAARDAVLQGRWYEAEALYNAAIDDNFPDRAALEAEKEIRRKQVNPCDER